MDLVQKRGVLSLISLGLTVAGGACAFAGSKMDGQIQQMRIAQAVDARFAQDLTSTVNIAAENAVNNFENSKIDGYVNNYMTQHVDGYLTRYMDSVKPHMDQYIDNYFTNNDALDARIAALTCKKI